MNVRVPAVTLRGRLLRLPAAHGLEVLAVDRGWWPATCNSASSGSRPDQPIPAVISTRLLEIYNKTFAPARKLPQISPQMLVGFGFPVESTAPTSPVPPRPDHPRRRRWWALDRALLAGITIPLDMAIRLNRASGVDAETFTGVTLVAHDPPGAGPSPR